jgi:hypothetical protein
MIAKPFVVLVLCPVVIGAGTGDDRLAERQPAVIRRDELMRQDVKPGGAQQRQRPAEQGHILKDAAAQGDFAQAVL